MLTVAPMLDFAYYRLKYNEVVLTWFQTFAVYWMLYAFFWVNPRRLKFIYRRFGTLLIFRFYLTTEPESVLKSAFFFVGGGCSVLIIHCIEFSVWASKQ